MDNKSKKTNKLLLLWYSYPRVAVGLVLLAINLAIILLFTVILSLISGNGFFDELSYLFTYTMCSDGIYDFVNSQEDLACFIVKIILTVIQMIIFSGALIGFTTDIISNLFDNRLQNKGKMYLENHFVFLNWSPIGQNIIHDLSFLDGEKTVVILTDDDREDVSNSIDNIFTTTGNSRKGLRVFVKEGDPTSSKHLADISISEAKYVGILLPEHSDEFGDEISAKDLKVFKLMLTLLKEAPNANIVVETESEIAKEKFEQLISTSYPKDKQRVSVFSHNSVMGHILGRITVNPAFASLFHSVLSFDGAEFYGVPTMDLEEALQRYNNCIPIINYDDDDEIDDDGCKRADQLYVLSNSEQNLSIRSEKKSFVRPLEYRESIQPEEFTLFIFSDSNRVQFVKSELENMKLSYNAKIHYEVISYSSEIDEAIHRIETTAGKRKILMLSEEKANPAEQDSAVFLLLLHLKTNQIIAKNVEICVELVNIDNMVPVRNLGIASVVLTNKIISLFMLQLLTHGGSRKFFKDILLTNADTGVIDFDIIPAEQLLVFKSDSLAFSCYSEIVQSFFTASNKRKMLIGYYPEGTDGPCFFCNEMDKERTVYIRPNDKLIVASYGT